MADATTTAETTTGNGPGLGPDGGAGFDLSGFLGGLRERSDILMALGVVSILVVLILPLPSWLLDFALATSITFSALILMVALFIQRPLDFG